MKPASLAVVILAVFGLVKGDDKSQEDLSRAVSDLGQRIHQTVGRYNQSLVFSPMSLHSSLTMLYRGARNETQNEMERVLNISSFDDGVVHDTYRQLLSQLKNVDEVKILTLNALYVSERKSIEEAYKKDVEDMYLGKVTEVKMDDREQAERKINDDIADKTDNKIRDLIERGSIDANTSMIVASSLCFNGSWQNAFNKNKTQKQDFTCVDGTKYQVDMMNDTRTILIKKDEQNKVDVAQLPLKGGRFSVCIVLPRENDGITELEKKLTRQGLVDDLCDNLLPKYVHLAIPKFKIESRMEIKSLLVDMGMQKSVDPDQADFSGISRSDKLYLSQVVQKTVIDVQEDGVSAASATSQVESWDWERSTDAADEKFIADHSFLFFVKDNQSQEILLQGKYGL